jgi:predicted Rossmann-fold nucleotide-binding protein
MSGDVLASLGGSVGTIVEIFMAYANSIPSYVLVGYGLDSDRVEAFSPYADYRRLTTIKTFRRDPVGMAREICEDVSKGNIKTLRIYRPG